MPRTCLNREVAIAFAKNPNLKNIVREMDDVLVFGESQQEVEEQFCELLRTCRESRITLSPKKTVYAGPGEHVRYAGMKISGAGAEMSDERAEKLRSYPEPTNRRELAAWVGLAAQCSSWFPEVNQASFKMRQLLKKDVQFVWHEELSKEFQDMKRVLCSKIVLSSFHQNYETRLLVDSSIKYGIAYLLIQISPEGAVSVIRCGSCSVPKAWHSLSAIEVEAAGISWSTNHARHYLRGAPMFTIVTDHQPLVKVLTGDLENLSPKLFRCVTEMLDYNYTVVWTPGKSHQVVDALGRVPKLESFRDWDPLSDSDGTDWEEGGNYAVHQSVNNVTHLDPQLGLQITRSMMVAVNEDMVYQRILEEVGVRSKRGLRQLPRDHPAQALKQVWDSLGRVQMPDGKEMVVVDSTRLYIPVKARDEVLETLHITHLGVAKMCAAARNLFYWPHLRRDVEKVVQGCEACQVFSPSKPREEQLQHGDFATRPMSQLAFDLFYYGGSQFLHILDVYSNFVFTRKMRATPSTEMVIKTMEEIFEAFGFPEVLYSDSGPQMRATFTRWASGLGIDHRVSSAYFASSNGAVERSLKSLKILMKKRKLGGETGLEEAVNLMNSAPITEAGMSAARLFFGRPLRNPRLTLLEDGLEESMEAGRKIEDREWKKQTANERISRRAALELKAGDRVRMQSQKSGLWDRCGVISEVRESGRSAYVKCSGSNRLYLRNRIFLKKDTIEEEDEDEEEDEGDDSVNTVSVYIVHAASTDKPAKSAMKKAGGDEWAGQRRRRHGPQLRVSFSLGQSSEEE